MTPRRLSRARRASLAKPADIEDMTDISLTRLEVRTGNTPSWLYLRAITEGPHHNVRGRLWVLLPLEEDPNFGVAQTWFDPDSQNDVVMGGCAATGSLLLGCGCSREVFGVGNSDQERTPVVNFFTRDPNDPEGGAVCCPAHRSFGRAWSDNPDPLGHLTAVLTGDELAAIRASIVARRDGLTPMALAGICGAAGICATEADIARNPDQIESLAVLAGLRVGGLAHQPDPAWFRVR